MKIKFIYILIFLGTILSCKNKAMENPKNLALRANVEQLEPEALREVQDWEGYLALEKNIILISNTNALNAIDMMDNLEGNCNLMSQDIPDKLEIPEIKNKVEDVNKEIRDFHSEVNSDEIREAVVQHHLKTILKAFDTLNKEINHVL